jgi:hypothetical protein
MERSPDILVRFTFDAHPDTFPLHLEGKDLLRERNKSSDSWFPRLVHQRGNGGRVPAACSLRPFAVKCLRPFVHDRSRIEAEFEPLQFAGVLAADALEPSQKGVRFSRHVDDDVELVLCEEDWGGFFASLGADPH